MRNIKDYLHLYLGCEVAGYKDQVTRSKIVGFYSDTIILSPHEYATPAGTFTRPEMRVNINAVKPILRPLSDMTEDEGIEVCKFIVVEKRQNQIDLQELTSSHIWYIDGEMWYGDGVSEVYDKYIKFNELSADQFRYMLSKGFDLFGLIDAGLAIDKTKQP